MRITGWSLGASRARLAALPAIVIAGGVLWLMLPEASDAESPSIAAPSEVFSVSQITSEPDSVTATQSIVTSPPAASTDADPIVPVAPLDLALPDMVAPARSPLDGLKIYSQSWRRGGLGSKALVTFTLRNANDYAVRDIEIACAFTRRDGSHLTDRRRVIPDTVNMKSRKRYAGVLIGFVNVNANKAKCSLVTASRI